MYSKVLDRLSEEKLRDYLTYIDYPVEVRRMIYTTNSIENLNRQIRKVTKTKVCFGNENNLLNLVFMAVKDFEVNNWQKYPVTTFRYWPRFIRTKSDAPVEERNVTPILSIRVQFVEENGRDRQPPHSLALHPKKKGACLFQ